MTPCTGLTVNELCQILNANPTGKNQYTGKGGGARSKGQRRFRVKPRDPWVPDTAKQAQEFLASKPKVEHLKTMSRRHLSHITKISKQRD